MKKIKAPIFYSKYDIHITIFSAAIGFLFFLTPILFDLKLLIYKSEPAYALWVAVISMSPTMKKFAFVYVILFYFPLVFARSKFPKSNTRNINEWAPLPTPKECMEEGILVSSKLEEIAVKVYFCYCKPLTYIMVFFIFGFIGSFISGGKLS